jgi:carbon starvation protein CstA
MGKTETFFERHVWKILMGVSLIIGFFGVSDMVGGASDLQNGETVLIHSITGMSWNELQAASPKVANLIDVKFRMDGATLATIALLSMAVCLTGFRRRERWAWYTLWAIPLWMMLTVVFILMVDKQPGSGTPVPIISGSILTVIWVSMLGLSYRKFFRS